MPSSDWVSTWVDWAGHMYDQKMGPEFCPHVAQPRVVAQLRLVNSFLLVLGNLIYKLSSCNLSIKDSRVFFVK